MQKVLGLQAASAGTKLTLKLSSLQANQRKSGAPAGLHVLAPVAIATMAQLTAANAAKIEGQCKPEFQHVHRIAVPFRPVEPNMTTG